MNNIVSQHCETAWEVDCIIPLRLFSSGCVVNENFYYLLMVFKNYKIDITYNHNLNCGDFFKLT